MEVLIKVQNTPNPHARKFVTNHYVAEDQKASFSSLEEAESVPLAHNLMNLPHVKSVHLFENVVTVTHNGRALWENLGSQIEDTMRQWIPHHDPRGVSPVDKRKRKDLPPELAFIDQILDHTIRPALQADGGDIELVALEGDILKIRYEGACGTCPSSMGGTLQAIEGILKEKYHPDIDVCVVDLF